MNLIIRKPFIIILIIGLLLYLPSLFGKFVWDDEDFVFANRYVQRFEIGNLFTQSITSGRNKGSNYFRPVQGTIYATTYQLMGPNPFWFHLLNILAHIGAASVIFIFFKKIVKGKTSAIPLLIALLFLVHPIQTEAVSYVSGLSDPLFVMFGFLSLVFFLLRDSRKNMIPLSLGFFFLSLLSKETGLVFLPLVATITFLQSRVETLLGKLIASLRTSFPFIVLATTYLSYHALFIGSFNIKLAWGNSSYANSLTVRLLTFIQNLFTYVGLLIFPKDLFMERDYWVQIQTHILNPYLILFIIINLAIIGSIFFLYQKRHLQKVELSILVFCYTAFFISFTPYTGIVLINGIFYEHFLYLPLVFFFAFWLILLKSQIEKFPKVSYTIIFLFLLGLIARNLNRQLEWVDPVKFYTQTLSHAPQSVRVTNGLGIAYSEKGDLEKAIEIYKKGIKMSPQTPNFYHNIANDYASMKNFSEAEKYYLEAIEADPNFIFSWQSLARLYEQTNQRQKLTALLKRFNEISKINL